MKYAIQATIRCDTEEQRDALFESMKKELRETFPGDDSQIQIHRCFHDEEPTRPCEVEEVIKAKKDEIRRV